MSRLAAGCTALPDNGINFMLRGLWRDAGPEQVNGDAQQHENQSRPGVLRLVTQQRQRCARGKKDVERRKPRIAEGFVRPRGIRALAAQDEQAADGEDVKEQHRKDDVVEKLTVGSGYAKDDRPDSLNSQRRRGRFVTRMQPTYGADEEAVAAHGVINAG